MAANFNYHSVPLEFNPDMCSTKLRLENHNLKPYWKTKTANVTRKALKSLDLPNSSSGRGNGGPLTSTQVEGGGGIERLCKIEMSTILHEDRRVSVQHCIARGDKRAMPKSADDVNKLREHFDFRAQAVGKKTMRSNSQRTGRKPKVAKRMTIAGNIDPGKYTCDIYNEEYLEDIYVSLRHVERRTLVAENYLQLQNNQAIMRATVINWLIGVQVQEKIPFIEAELYLAINIMDQLLAKVHISREFYGLVLLTSLWIACKILSPTFLSTTKLAKVSGVYSSEQIVNMERWILKLLDFHIHSHEPSIFLNYFHKKLKLNHAEILHILSYYILDCFTLCPEFSVHPSSVIAAAAVCLAISIHHNVENDPCLHRFFQRHLSKQDMASKSAVEMIMRAQLGMVSSSEYEFKEVCKKKYSQEIGKI